MAKVARLSPMICTPMTTCRVGSSAQDTSFKKPAGSPLSLPLAMSLKYAYPVTLFGVPVWEGPKKMRQSSSKNKAKMKQKTCKKRARMQLQRLVTNRWKCNQNMRTRVKKKWRQIHRDGKRERMQEIVIRLLPVTTKQGWVCARYAAATDDDRLHVSIAMKT